MKKLLFTTLLSFLVFNLTFGQEISVDWQPVETKNQQLYFSKIIHSTDKFYYKYVRDEKFNFTGIRYSQKIIMYNKKHEEINAIEFENGVEHVEGGSLVVAKRIKEFIITNENIVLYYIKENEGKSGTQSHYLKSVPLNLDKQTDWMFIDNSKSVDVVKLIFNQFSNQIFFMKSDNKDKVEEDSKVLYKIIDPNTLDVIGKNDILVDANLSDSRDVEVYAIAEDEILIKAIINITGLVKLYRHELMSNSVSTTDFETKVNGVYWYDFTYNPLNKCFYLMTINKVVKKEDVNIYIERYLLETGDVEPIIINKLPYQIIEENIKKNPNQTEISTIFSKGNQFYLLFNMKETVKTKVTKVSQDGRASSYIDVAYYNYSIGVVFFSSLNQIKWFHIIPRLSHFDNVSYYNSFYPIIHDDRLSIYFYDKRRMYDGLGNYMNVVKELKSIKGADLAYCLYDSTGFKKRQLAGGGMRLNKKLKKPFVNFYSIYPMGKDYLVSYNFKRKNALGIMKVK